MHHLLGLLSVLTALLTLWPLPTCFLTWNSLPPSLLLSRMLTNHITRRQKASPLFPGVVWLGTALRGNFFFISTVAPAHCFSLDKSLRHARAPGKHTKNKRNPFPTPSYFFPILVKNRTFSNGSILDGASVEWSPK